jgi:uncharacterized membrane protein YkvA (DUF1232 family)
MTPEHNPDTNPESVGPRGTNRYESRAADYLSDSDKARSLLDEAQKKAGPAKAITRILDDSMVLLRMIRAYVDGRYREIPWLAILTATAAIVYFVTPADFIPDFIAGLGLLDDAAVLTWTLGAVSRSLSDFRAWESKSEHRSRQSPPDELFSGSE